MNNVDIVKDVTDAFCRNRGDRGVLDRYFSADFEHWANGKRSDLQGYAAHLESYMKDYESFRIPAWDELFAADDKVVASYTLEAARKGGGTDKLLVMAIWRLKNGKVVSLREIDVPA